MYQRLITSFFFRTQGNMSQRVTTILTPKMVNYNAIFYKLVMWEKNKRKTIEASTFRAPLEKPIPQEENIGRGEHLTFQEEAIQPPPQPPYRTKKWEALDALNERVDHMAINLEEV